MTANFTADDDVSNPDEFEAALGQIILGALQADIDLRGAWEYRTDDGTPDVEVTIVELAER